jgi:hypothetical protein
MSDEARQFLIRFRRSTGTVDVEDLGTDAEAAAARYERLEAEYLGIDDVEVVMLESDSLETLKRTHASYFGTSEAIERLVGRYSPASSS